MILPDVENQEFMENHESPEDQPLVEGQVSDEAGPRGPDRTRRVAIIVLGVILATALFVVVAVAFAEGSWWYFNMTDRPLSNDAREHLQAIREDVAAGGIAPAAVAWLDAALDPNADPTAVRARLIEAQEILGAADDTARLHAAEEVEAIVQTMRPWGWSSAGTPRIVPTLAWNE